MSGAKRTRAAVVAAIAIATLALCGCKAVKYVPVETVRTEFQDKVREVHTTDSVTDTRFVYVKGDTVIDYRDRVRWRDRLVYDSIFIERTDSVQIPYPVERELTRWQRTKMDFGGMAMGALVIVLCFAVAWLIKRFKR